MPTVTRQTIGDGDLGTAQTLAAMAALIREGVATPIVREAAADILNGIASNDWHGQAEAVREWVADHVMFTHDPAGIELLQSPEFLLRAIASNGYATGDCDDISLLSGALIGSVGWSVSLVTVAFLGSDAYSHVYTSATPPTANFVDSAGNPIWIEFDTSRPMQELPMNLISRSQTYDVL